MVYMNDINSAYPWVPFFKELVNSLLQFKKDRGPLLNWLKKEIAVSKGMDKKKLKFCDSLIDPTRKDIDPFSVISILCKKYHFESAEGILQKYKSFFNIQCEASTSDWGRVTNNDIAFLFSNKETVINTLWELFEKVLADVDITFEYNKLHNSEEKTYYFLTHILSWVCPEKYLALNGPTREYLENFNVFVKEPPTYEQYMQILEQVNKNLDEGLIPCSSLLQLTELIQKEGTTSKIWFIPAPKDIMIYGKSHLFEYISNQKKKEKEQFYNEVIPRTDIIVLYKTIDESNKKYLQLYGWGRFNNKKLRLQSDMLSEIEWHPYVDNSITLDYSEQKSIFKLNSNADITEKLQIYDQNTITHMKLNKYQKYIDLLEANKNLILTGAPGTGKTFMAKTIAAEMMGLRNVEELSKDEHFGFVQFHPSYDYTDFVEGLRPIEKEGQLGFKRKDGVFVEFCKNALSAFTKQDGNLTKEKAKESILLFKTRCNGKELWFGFDKGSGIFTVITHWDAPIYAVVVDKYSSPIPVKVSEDKIIEYLTNPNIPSYEKDIYEESIAEYIETFILNKNRKYVFIIDEINRGEISKIFGELFFSIDPGCRGKDGQVKTQYANMVTEPNEFDVALETKDYGHFYVPENVYIIGTMNEIDRSVEDMDFAMQRRFAKVEVTAEKSFQNIIADSNDFSEDEKAEIKARMTALNDAILEPELGLGEAYQVGAAYFLKYLKYKKYGMNQAFTMLWDYHLKGLLVDYLRGNHNLKDQIETLKKAYDSKVKKV